MEMILNALRKEREYSDALNTALSQIKASSPCPLLVTGLCDGAKTAMYAALTNDIKAKSGCGCFFIVPEEKYGSQLCEELRAFGTDAYFYPYRDFVFHDITASREYEYERLGILGKAVNGDYDAIIATPNSALQFTIPQKKIREKTFEIKASENYDPQNIISMLISAGYARTDMVDGKGQFSVRGGILDIFPPSSKNPVRIEFFDTEIEQMASFDILTQRKSESIDEVIISPAREVIADEETKNLLYEYISAEIKKQNDIYTKDLLKNEAEAIKTRSDINFIDKYISFIYPERECLLDYFGKKALSIFEDLNSIEEKLKAYEWHNSSDIEDLLENGGVRADICVYGKSGNDFKDFLIKNPSLENEQFMGKCVFEKQSGIFSFQTRQLAAYGEDFKLLCNDLNDYANSKHTMLLLTDNETSAKTLCSMLESEGISSYLTDISEASVISGAKAVTYGFNIQSFELVRSGFSCISLCENVRTVNRTLSKTGRTIKNKNSRERIMSYADLEIGDYVVHVNYGIGQYKGIHTLTFDGVTKDFMKVIYAGNDVLYIPCNQIEMLSKYIGTNTDDGNLKLSKMGGPEWVKAKRKVKASAKIMAKELIELYARRLRIKGFAFGKEEQIERDFANSFEFDETDGQITAISEITHDMENSYPMDRLLCGDVGFGKTEVALRAAFKAVCNQKQVAVLVPTTILAMQHYQTFMSRMRGFPVNVDVISRFRTEKQQRETANKIRRGETDILIGTHRILSKDIDFKDLGLIIIDEEQRFGVAQKEKLKQISSNVDVLTLTATPIPRTLSMSMSGIRDMSILEEAPNDRLPVQTYVLKYDETIISDAIKKELYRGGQVFYLCNSVEKMDDTVARVRRLSPADARIGFAHGQMEKEELSDIWKSLICGDIDILVTTTIIETGIDVPNANTLIIENSDRFGLSQLHQIRGRIGRSSRRAYAYLTYPRGKALSEIAVKRLVSIRDYTEFGSGFKIALRDLEIRGAGNILGAEQHGHIASVGYDMYMRLLNEAILEEKGESVKQRTECAIDINCNAYIPEKYISVPSQRIDAYKKISLIENDEDMADVCDELLDRYGDLPKCVEVLLKISLIRAYFSDAGIFKINQKGSYVFLYPKNGDVSEWVNIASGSKNKISIGAGRDVYICAKVGRLENPVSVLTELMNLHSKSNKT